MDDSTKAPLLASVDVAFNGEQFGFRFRNAVGDVLDVSMTTQDAAEFIAKMLGSAYDWQVQNPSPAPKTRTQPAVGVPVHRLGLTSETAPDQVALLIGSAGLVLGFQVHRTKLMALRTALEETNLDPDAKKH